MANYPRVCRNGHAIAGPQHEYSNGRTGARKCAACMQRRHATSEGIAQRARGDTNRQIRRTT